ncbi:hypothetical protein TPHA_0B03940 [Tetrapisispora phaffii CBS 4417]|uniref:2-hydroxyacyl-CoA lyase n=1 Tax=Tetrapisispora phaffii (strain ATCC 24235 / CBS 4417 / NBRC 1672 / NRRL Y-8282 / UCD 70-5) TaxID=1071381 RepID=G8BPY5_TETPH|nr:hypothetical protein TPHA_0B03940 [Tetrapisispora phaffii CBS 4417]CCE62066.1 hypothetical protein TPHA_0B03940 [Tetrapisispora phaffii CBS 4417]
MSGISVPDYISTVLKKYDIDTVFGIVGIPIVELAESFITNGIKFISFRNEQSASYAASLYGYLNNKPGVLLTVGGPGLIHALAGIYNSIENNWPLIVITGGIESQQKYKNGFQELNHIALLNSYMKFTGELSTENIDLLVYESMRNSMLSPKGVSFLEIPGDLIHKSVGKNIGDSLAKHKPILVDALTFIPNDDILLETAKFLYDAMRKRDQNMLVIVGKGAIGASSALRHFINCFNLPFLPTPMAKGIIEDSNELNVSSGRSMALKDADVILVFGAKLNWILHYGDTPKFKDNVKFIQVDNNTKTIGLNNQRGLQNSLIGDIESTVKKLTMMINHLQNGQMITYKGLSKAIKEKILSNAIKLNEKENATPRVVPNANSLNYNVVFGRLKTLFKDEETILVTEGANTMDVARISFPTDFPQHRIDCGTLATMGIGLGYAISTKLSKPNKSVVLIQGDSAFGFSGLELETSVRFNLGLIVVIMNNSGIYHGTTKDHYLKGKYAPPTILSQNCRYDIVGKGLGCAGYLITNLDELTKYFKLAMIRSIKYKETSVLNVLIEPGKQGKLEFGWQSKPRL